MAKLTYPALVDLNAQKAYPFRGAESFLVGRNETADLCVTDLKCSRHQFRVVRSNGRYVVEPLSRNSPTICAGRQLVGPVPLDHEAVLQAGNCRFQFFARSPGSPPVARSGPPVATAAGKPGRITVPAPEPEDENFATVRARPGEVAELSLDHEIALAGTMVVGRDPSAQIVLPHPQVSRRHAVIMQRGAKTVIRDERSANGTFVNGRRVDAAGAALQQGDQIDIGPYALQFTGTLLIPRSRSNNVELTAYDVCRVVTDRETGKPLSLLDGITLVVRPREFVCLLGPSGSGKTTLLSMLSGRSAPDGGVVLVNQADLHANFEGLKQDIALVPQKDVLHDSLTVGGALWYTARLRLPPDTMAGEIDSAIDEMLDTVSLTARRGTTIRHLSGGQVKRASLANEILCKPSLLFLDEVTSGLDEQTDREMMNLFRAVADAGKTVVCITHSLANVERTCHLVVILTAGGKLAFVGRPAEALEYFGIERLGDVYQRLAEQPAESWQNAFLSSAFCQRYIAERLPAKAPVANKTAPSASGGIHGMARLFLRQAALLTRRYLAIWRGDYASLLAMFGQSVLVALLLVVVFGDLRTIKEPFTHAQRSLNLLFLLAVSSFWFGCNNAAKEIVKERTIYERERDFNLLVNSYYASKLLLLTTFSCIQVVVLFSIVRSWCGVPGSAAGQLLVLMALAVAGTTLGLLISAISATEEMAVTLIPIAVIPQIILSGAIAPLSGFGKLLASIGITTYWGKRGLDALLPDDVTKSAGLDQRSMAPALLVVLGHCLICTILAVGVLVTQKRRTEGLLQRLKRIVVKS